MRCGKRTAIRKTASARGAPRRLACFRSRAEKHMRKRRTDAPNAIHHLTCRVNWQAFHLREPDHAHVYFQELERALRRFDVALFAYVMMSNHHHLVVRSPEEPRFRELTTYRTRSRHRRPFPSGHQKSTVIAQFMRRLHRRVSYRLQEILGVSGHLWGRRYHARAVRGPTDLTTTIAYDHRNPVRPNIVAEPEHYLWSSADAYANREREAPVALADDSRLPFDLTWLQLRARVLEYQGSHGLDDVLLSLEKERQSSQSNYETLLQRELEKQSRMAAKVRRECRTETPQLV